MAKYIQRTIIVTVVESWSLSWDEPGGPINSPAGVAGGANDIPLHSWPRHQNSIGHALSISSSSVTVALPISDRKSR